MTFRWTVLAGLLAVGSAESLPAAPPAPAVKTFRTPYFTVQLGPNNIGLQFPQQPGARPAVPPAPSARPAPSILQPAPTVPQLTIGGPSLSQPAQGGPVRSTVFLPGVEELPSPTMLPGAPNLPSQTVYPPMQPLPAAPAFTGGYVPAPGPVPAAQAVYCPTIREFAATFRGIPGQSYDLMMIHPRTRCPVRVCFTLPLGNLCKVDADSTELRFVYSGGYELEVHFKRGGAVELDFDD